MKDKAGNSTSKTRNVIVSSPSAVDIVNSASGTMSNDPGGNARYVGSNPNNYVKFNNELWKIIGVFNGQVKIIRNTPYSTGIKWDTDAKND